MVVENGKYYLYRHIRLDKNEPFYIGIGKKPSKTNPYLRAKTKRGRNVFWKNITAKVEYIVDIMLESDDDIFIFEKEKEFIQVYGRRDLGNGTLVNLNDGGRSGLNKSQFSIDNQIKTAKRNGNYDKMIERAKKMSFKKGANGNYQDKKTYLYDVNGFFIKEFKTREDCADYIDTFSEEIIRIIKLKISHKGYICSNTYEGIKIDISKFTIRKQKQKELIQFDFNKTEIINIHKSLTIAAKSIGVFKTSLSVAIKKGHRCKNYYWQYK